VQLVQVNEIIWDLKLIKIWRTLLHDFASLMHHIVGVVRLLERWRTTQITFDSFDEGGDRPPPPPLLLLLLLL